MNRVGLRRLFDRSIITATIIALAVPYGAVFASEINSAEILPTEVAIGEQTVRQPVELTVENEDAEAREEATSQSTPDAPEAKQEPPVATLQEAPMVSSDATAVVISELATRGLGGANSERIELYNASALDVDITNWCLQRESSSGALSNVYCFTTGSADVGAIVLLPAGGSTIASVDATQRLLSDVAL